MKAKARAGQFWRRSCLLLVPFLIAMLLAADGLRRPQQQLLVKLSVVCIGVYRATASPLLARAGVRCRFNPTCSRYAERAVLEHGFVRGAGLAAWRVLRCGPWTPKGTNDPVSTSGGEPEPSLRVAPEAQ